MASSYAMKLAILHPAPVMECAAQCVADAVEELLDRENDARSGIIGGATFPAVLMGAEGAIPRKPGRRRSGSGRSSRPF